MALQPGVGLGLPYNMPPGLSVPCSLSPFVYTHLSQVHGHAIQPSHSWSSSSSRCIQLSVQHLFGIAVSCILSICPSHRILWHLINLTMFSPLIMASNSSFCRVRLWDNVEKYCWARQATNDNMAHAHCLCWKFKATNAHSKYVITTYCFSTVTTEARTRLSVTYVHCLSCSVVHPS